MNTAGALRTHWALQNAEIVAWRDAIAVRLTRVLTRNHTPVHTRFLLASCGVHRSAADCATSKQWKE
jgi:hypothetical protein